MTGGEAAGPPATSSHDLRAVAPIVARGAALSALAVLALGQLPPLLVNLAGGGLAVATQLRVGWFYAMAGHAVAIELSGATGSEGPGVDVASVRLGMLTIAAFAVVVLARSGRAGARRVDDVGIRRAVAGASVAVPYAVALGVVNALVTLRLDTGGGFLPGNTTISAPIWEGFALPGALALVAGGLGGWSASASWHRGVGVAVRTGSHAFAWAIGLSLVGLLAFAALRPEGLERYAMEVGSAGPRRAGLYLGHQALLLPDQAMWVLATSMGGCVSLRAGEAAHGVICLDRIPRGPDPATWLLTELGRTEGSPQVAPMPPVAWLLLAVPIAALAVACRAPGRSASSAARGALLGAAAGVVFAVLVTVTSLAGSLWLGTRGGGAARSVALGPDPVTTAALALGWGVLGGAVACSAWWWLSRRARPR